MKAWRKHNQSCTAKGKPKDKIKKKFAGSGAMKETPSNLLIGIMIHAGIMDRP